ncbi:MAG: WD40 repeat domain-containing protein [Saprospiraceae bacterium]
MIIKKTAQLTGHNAGIYALAEGLTDHTFLSAAGDGWIVQWDLNDPDLGQLLAKVETQVFSLCTLIKEKKVVAGNMNGGIHWVDLENPALTKNVAHHEKGVYDILRVGEHLFTAGGEGKLTRWSIPEMKTIESYHLANQSLRCIAFSKKRNELAIGATDHSIYLLDADTLELKCRAEKAHENSVFCLRYSPDEKRLISGGRDAHLNVWDLENGLVKINSLPGHWFTINSIDFHPKGHIFATGSRDKTIKIWDAESYELLKVLELNRDGGHLNSVNRLLWHEHEKTLVSCSDDRTIILWNIS